MSLSQIAESNYGACASSIAPINMRLDWPLKPNVSLMQWKL